MKRIIDSDKKIIYVDAVIVFVILAVVGLSAAIAFSIKIIQWGLS